MSNDFIDGLIAKEPHENAPDFIKAKLSIKVEELLTWLGDRTEEWVNADVKVSKGGKWYVAVDDWKPKEKEEEPRRRKVAFIASSSPAS